MSKIHFDEICYLTIRHKLLVRARAEYSIAMRRDIPAIAVGKPGSQVVEWCRRWQTFTHSGIGKNYGKILLRDPFNDDIQVEDSEYTTPPLEVEDEL